MIWEDKKMEETIPFQDIAIGEVFETDFYDDSIPIIFIKVSKNTAFDICNNDIIGYEHHLTDEVCPRESKLILK